MKFVLSTALAFACAAPAIAQSTNQNSGEPTSTPPTASSSTGQSTPSAPTTAESKDPATILRTEFPAYDKDASGALNQSEFSTWLVALKAAAPQQTPMTAAQQSEWLGKAFTEADVDKSSTVSLAELTDYLTRGAKS